MSRNSQTDAQPANVFSLASLNNQLLAMTATTNEGFSDGLIMNEVAFAHRRSFQPPRLSLVVSLLDLACVTCAPS